MLGSAKLRFVASEERYSVYLDSDGDEVYLAHGTGVRMVALDELDVQVLWHNWVRTKEIAIVRGNHLDEFLDVLRGRLVDEYEIDDIRFCVDCNEPDHEDDLFFTNECNGSVCYSCLDRYYACGACDERFRDTTTTLSGDEICCYCRDDHYTYCESCDGYHHDDDSYEHEHRSETTCEDDCESPAQRFNIRNDGEAPLANDTPATITLAAGYISGEGLSQISYYLREQGYKQDTDPDTASKFYALAFNLSALGAEWQTKDGNYTKRLSRKAYKDHGLKLQPEIVSRVGCIASDHSQAVDVQIETTRDLNQSPEEFAHEESCWWQSYYHGRCALKTNGGFGLRSFTQGFYGREVSGRAWVMPVRYNPNPINLQDRFTETFDTVTPDAFIVFNGYGDLENYAPARILGHMTGMTYRKIAFSCDPMYVNNNSGYLIAPEEIAEHYTDGMVRLNVEQHSNLFHTEIHNHEKVLVNA